MKIFKLWWRTIGIRGFVGFLITFIFGCILSTFFLEFATEPIPFINLILRADFLYLIFGASTKIYSIGWDVFSVWNIYFWIGAFFYPLTKAYMYIEHPTQKEQEEKRHQELYRNANPSAQLQWDIHQDIVNNQNSGCLSSLFTIIGALIKMIIFFMIWPWSVYKANRKFN